MECIEHLGKKLTRKEVETLFPQNKYGVNLSANRSSVDSLKLIISQGKRSGYANAILGTNKVAFVESPNRAANRILETMIDAPIHVRLHLVYNGDDYDYGSVRVVGTDQMKEQRRFLMERVMIGDKPALGKRSLDESSEEPTQKRTCTVVRDSPVEWNYDGYTYDSKLESRHACFFDAVGITYHPHCITVTLCDDDGKEIQYTPDFYLADVGDKGLYVEIKPRYPHEEEWQKIELMVSRFKFDVLLLYGNFTTGMPYSNEDKTTTSPSKRRHYTHAESVRGILWRGSDGTRTEGVVWGIDEDTGKPSIIYRRGMKDTRWKSSLLQRAYETAANYDGVSGTLPVMNDTE